MMLDAAVAVVINSKCCGAVVSAFWIYLHYVRVPSFLCTPLAAEGRVCLCTAWRLVWLRAWVYWWWRASAAAAAPDAATGAVVAALVL